MLSKWQVHGDEEHGLVGESNRITVKISRTEKLKDPKPHLPANPLASLALRMCQCTDPCYIY